MKMSEMDLEKKEMNKQEMAEWLAENVLRWQYCSDCETWVSDLGEHWRREPSVSELIYSPDGFFAVWDKCLEEGFQSLEIEVLNVEPDGQETWECRLYDHQAKGKDRYEAFYNAVYEALK